MELNQMKKEKVISSFGLKYFISISLDIRPWYYFQHDFYTVKHFNFGGT